MSIYFGYKTDIIDSFNSTETLKIKYASLTNEQVRLLKSSWEMINDDFMRCSELLFSRLMREAPDSIDLFTFAKGSGMYNPNYELDMKRHSLKVVNAISWSVSKCDKFDEIKPDLINLGERHRNYGLKLCYIRPMESVILDMVKEYLGHLYTDELEATWAHFLRILLYSVFHTLLRQHISKRRQRIYIRNLDGKVIAVTDKRVFLFWVIVGAVAMAWLRLTFERYKRL